MGGILYGVSRLENKTITALAVVLVGGLVLAVIIFASSFPIRAAKGPTPPERHVYHTKEKIIDGRPVPPPTVVQAPAVGTPMLPELLRAAYGSGTCLPAGAAQHGRDERNEPIGAGWGDVWDGQIVDAEFEEV